MKCMRIVFVIVFAAFCMGVVFSCGKEETSVESDATTRGAVANDSTDNKGGITITVDTT